jgi:NAD-dependent deacetylase
MGFSKVPTASVEDAAAIVAASRRTLVFTGAGVSTESGIPDFRGPQGLWKKVDPNLFTLQNYLADPAIRRAAWKMRVEDPVWTAQPNPSHHAIVHLERLGVAPVVVTQNVDGLHQAAGSSDVVEVHGSIHSVVCLACGWRGPMAGTLARVRGGEADPACEACGGILKSATIAFGQHLEPAVIERAFAQADAADVCVAAGSTLSVTPAAHVPMAVASNGGALVIVNEEPTELDHMAVAVVRARTGTALPRLAELVAAQRAGRSQDGGSGRADTPMV